MANDLNHVAIIGRLTRDMESKMTSGGMTIGRFSIAVNRKKKQGDQWVEEVSFFDCVIFGKTAESLASYLVKGKQVAVEGELHQNRWEQDGQARSKIEINASNVQLLGGGDAKTAPAPSASRSAPPPEDDAPPKREPRYYTDENDRDVPPDFESDIPF
jgi:single-strand DNA-binding protein